MTLVVLEKSCPECRAPLASDGCCTNRVECGYYDSILRAAWEAAQEKNPQATEPGK